MRKLSYVLILIFGALLFVGSANASGLIDYSDNFQKIDVNTVILDETEEETTESEENCLLGPEVTKDLIGVLNIFKIVAPILCFAFAVFDVVKVFSAGDATSQMKNVAIKFGKRCGYAIILFFLPIIITTVLDLADISSGCDLNGTITSDSSVTTTSS